MLLIDKLSYSSRLRDKSPVLKAFLAVTTLLICVAARSVLFSFLVLTFMAGLTVILGGTSISDYIRLMRMPLTFLLISTVTILIGISKHPVEEPFIKLFGLFYYFESSKLIFGLQLISSAFGAVACLYFLSLTTPFTDILRVLQLLRCPTVISELLLLSYRYIFVLYETAAGITTAQESRLGNRSLKTALKGSTGLFSILFIRAMKKSSLLYDAMEARCYDGTIKVLWEKKNAGKGEIAAVILLVTVLGICSYFLKNVV